MIEENTTGYYNCVSHQAYAIDKVFTTSETVFKCQPAYHDDKWKILTSRYEKEFEEAYDLFEVQRILNNCFSYDLVPAPSVIEKALEACRRVNDYPTAVRTFEALKHKVENKEQYEAYLEELKDIRKELGIDLKENLYAEN